LSGENRNLGSGLQFLVKSKKGSALDIIPLTYPLPQGRGIMLAGADRSQILSGKGDIIPLVP